MHQINFAYVFVFDVESLPLLNRLLQCKILEKSPGSGSKDKNVFFMFLLETACLTNEFLENFDRELIIAHKIILNGNKFMPY